MELFKIRYLEFLMGFCLVKNFAYMDLSFGQQILHSQIFDPMCYRRKYNLLKGVHREKYSQQVRLPSQGMLFFIDSSVVSQYAYYPDCEIRNPK